MSDHGGLKLYGYVGNDPINNYDPLGLFEIQISNRYPSANKAALQNAINAYKATPSGAATIKLQPTKTVIIKPIAKGGQTGYDGLNLYLDPTDPMFLDDKTRQALQNDGDLPCDGEKGAVITLGHEFGHVVDDGSEQDIVKKYENPVRKDLGVSDRKKYGGKLIK